MQGPSPLSRTDRLTGALHTEIPRLIELSERRTLVLSRLGNELSLALRRCLVWG